MSAGPFLAACALLAVAGANKIVHPAPAMVAARAAGVPIARAGVVVFAVVEVSAAGAGALLGGRAALGVAASYIVLTAVAIRLLVAAPSTPCACLGSTSAVATRTHVALNVAAAAVAIAAATSGSPVARLSGNWIEAVVLMALVACSVKLAMLALETLPAIGAATKEGTT